MAITIHINLAVLAASVIGELVSVAWQSDAFPWGRYEEHYLVTALVSIFTLAIILEWITRLYSRRASTAPITEYFPVFVRCRADVNGSSSSSSLSCGLSQGRNHVFKVGGPIPWSRLLYTTKYGWYKVTQFQKLGWSVHFFGWGGPDPSPQWLCPWLVRCWTLPFLRACSRLDDSALDDRRLPDQC